jgi:hypothetical protein
MMRMMRTGNHIHPSAAQLRAGLAASYRTSAHAHSRVYTGIAVSIVRLSQALLRLDAAISSRALPFPETIKVRARARLAQVPIPDPVSRLYRWLAAHLADEVLIALLATALSIGFYAWYASHGWTSSLNDARIRTLIARRVLMGRTPGLAQLGTTWLPLHFLSMLPLIWNDTLFRSGLAGALPSMMAYVVASVYMYRTCHFLFASRGAGWIACMVVMLNPSILYMQSTAMSEVPLICTMILAIYYALQWSHSCHAVDMLKASAAVAAATAIRYDGWLLAVALAFFVANVAWRRQGYKAVQPWLILYSLLAFAGCVAWVIYNWVIFHDPLLSFFYGESSHSLSTRRLTSQTSTYHQLWRSLELYGFTTGAVAGWLIAALAVLGLVVFVFRFRTRATTLAVYTLLIPFAFYCLAFYLGVNRATVPELDMQRYYNVRFGMMMIPAVALFAAALVAALATVLVRRYRFLIIALFSLLVLLSSINLTLHTPYVLREALHGATSEAPAAARLQAQWFMSHYRGGDVLITYNFSTLMYYLMTEHNFPDRAFVTDANGWQFQAAVADPQDTVTWIVVDSGTEFGADVLWTALQRDRDWQHYFHPRYTRGTTTFFERVAHAGASVPPSRPPPAALGCSIGVQAHLSDISPRLKPGASRSRTPRHDAPGRER